MAPPPTAAVAAIYHCADTVLIHQVSKACVPLRQRQFSATRFVLQRVCWFGHAVAGSVRVGCGLSLHAMCKISDRQGIQAPQVGQQPQALFSGSRPRRCATRCDAVYSFTCCTFLVPFCQVLSAALKAPRTHVAQRAEELRSWRKPLSTFQKRVLAVVRSFQPLLLRLHLQSA